MTERTHAAHDSTHAERERTAHAHDSVQPERAPELLTYAEAAALLDASPNAVRMRCSRGSLVCEEADDGTRRVLWPQPERTHAARTRTRTHSERTHDERAPVRAERAPDEQAARIASLEAQLAEVRNHAAYVERLAEDRAEEVRRLIDAMQEQAIALRALQANAIPPAVLDVGPIAPYAPATQIEPRSEADPPHTGDETSKQGASRPWWKFW